MTSKRDMSRKFQVPLQTEYRANPSAFITKLAWGDSFPDADLAWNMKHSCYGAFGLEPKNFTPGQAGLDERGAMLVSQVRATGSVRGEIPLGGGNRLVLTLRDHPELPDDEPHIGYRVACLALGWLDKKRAGDLVQDDMLYNPEIRYADGLPHVVKPWLTVTLVRD